MVLSSLENNVEYAAIHIYSELVVTGKEMAPFNVSKDP